MTIFKYLLVLALTSPALSGGFCLVGTRADSSVIFVSDAPTNDLVHLGVPVSPITTYYAIPKTGWTATAQDAGDGVPVTIVNPAGTRVLNRGTAAVAAERVVAARILAKKMFLGWRQILTDRRKALSLAPGDPYFQAQVSEAASQVTSYASAASIPVTTATTQ